MKTYKVLKGYYNKIKEETITIPKNMKLLYDDGCIGYGLHHGHNHYLGCMRKSKLPKEITRYYEFDDLIFVVFDDIKFIDETPEFYTSEEFMNEFELNKYCIEFQTEGYFKNIDSVLECVESKEEFEEFIDDNYVEGYTYEIWKITDIKGPYSVKVFLVTNADRLFNEEYFNIAEDKRIPISQICKTKNLVIYKNDDSMFKEMINNVLKRAYYERI